MIQNLIDRMIEWYDMIDRTIDRTIDRYIFKIT